MQSAFITGYGIDMPYMPPLWLGFGDDNPDHPVPKPKKK